MPVVIPAAPNSSSALQSVPTQNVFDYLYDSQSNPLKGKRVVVTLGVENANAITPQVSLANLVVQTTTDNNGFWSVNLIPNANINPANTVYTVQVEQGLPDYQISVPSAGGPFQSTSPSVLVNTPGVLQPATSGITGNLAVSGNETVSGTLGVTGATSLGQLTAGATTTGPTTVGGDLTIGSAFRLLFGAAVSKIVPGATSISLRNNADNADNVLVTDAGLVTVRNGLTVTAGDIVATAGRLLVASAAAKILGGVTSLSLRNNADTADNVLVADSGLVNLRNALSVPVVAGGAIAPTSYGTQPIKYDEQAFTGTSVTIPASGTLPAGFRDILIRVYGRTSTAATNEVINLRFNGDSSANSHTWSNLATNSATPSGVVPTQTTFCTVGLLPAANATASLPGVIWIEIPEYLNTTFVRTLLARQGEQSGGTGFQIGLFAGNWNQTVALTSIVILTGAGGSGAAGSRVVTYLIP